ncbi:MAG: hypothetical protein SVX43_16385, partial [Cyanobacteriota bacterium]|nr:hypothetical protein [Cyanobacteriota bacterium]
ALQVACCATLCELMKNIYRQVATIMDREAQTRTRSFEQAWRSLADSRFLPFALLTAGTASNIIYAHAPLVAFAAMAGATLTRQRAIAVALLVWLVNQALGFGLRGYPLTSVALIWGALMGIGTLMVVAFASWRPEFSQSYPTGHFLWMAIAILGGFALYQGLILLAFPLLADGHHMGWDIVGKLFLKQFIWASAIALGHSLLLQRALLTQTDWAKG